ncbi:hypothetical protein Hanom_Chr16g01427131 [Helianthus anomalus]
MREDVIKQCLLHNDDNRTEFRLDLHTTHLKSNQCDVIGVVLDVVYEELVKNSWNGSDCLSFLISLEMSKDDIYRQL